MLLAVTIYSPGEFIVLMAICAGIILHFAKKHLPDEVKDTAKKAATSKAIGLIGKWLK